MIETSQQIVNLATIWRDYITIRLNPNANIVHLEDHVPGNANHSNNIVRNYHANRIDHTNTRYSAIGKLVPLSKSRAVVVLWAWLVDRITYLWNGFLVLFGIRHQTFRILLLGELGSGRSSLLDVLKGEPFIPNRRAPTLLPQTHNFKIDHDTTMIELIFSELGDQESARRLIPDYFQMAQGVLYMVDAANEGTLPSCKKVTDRLMSDKDLHGKPIVVLGNKIDISSAVAGDDELRKHLGLDAYDDTMNDKKSRIRLFMCSVKQKLGYVDALGWLHCQLTGKRRSSFEPVFVRN